MPRFRVTGPSVRDELRNRQIACKNHAFKPGVDRSDISDCKWPFWRSLT